MDIKKKSLRRNRVKAPVFNIQRFCIHDGPGIRTTVFLKGCNLNCWWCHNPEGKQAKPQLMFYANKCLGCAACVKFCPSGARSIHDGKIVFQRQLCKNCFACVEVCPGEALIRSGEIKTVEEIFQEVIRDKPFYETSGGGVTVSGGEPLLYPYFVKNLFIRLKKNSIPTAIETAGNLPWENFRTVLPWTDLFLYDLKTAEEKSLKQATGASLPLILKNLKSLLKAGAGVLIRIPLVPGFNDLPGQREKMVNLIKEIPGKFQVELLKYNYLASGKYRALNLNSEQTITPEQAESSFQKAVSFLNKSKIPLLID